MILLACLMVPHPGITKALPMPVMMALLSFSPQLRDGFSETLKGCDLQISAGFLENPLGTYLL